MVVSSFIFAGIGIFCVLLVLAVLMQEKLEQIPPKTLYFYVMSFVTLVMVADGIAVFLLMMFDLVMRGAFTMDVRRAFLECVTVLTVALPAYLFHWKAILAGLDDQQEKIIWPYYKYAVLGFSAIGTIIFGGALVYQFLGGVIGVSRVNWSEFSVVLGYGAVGAGVWAYHWFLERKFQI
jgi:hypothetical protein